MYKHLFDSITVRQDNVALAVIDSIWNDIEAFPIELKTSLIHAVVSFGRIEVLKRLRNIPGILKLSTVHGITPFIRALVCNQVEIVRYFIQEGIDSFVTPLHEAAFLQKFPNLTIGACNPDDYQKTDSANYTPLCYAAAQGDVDTFQFLLNNTKKDNINYAELVTIIITNQHQELLKIILPYTSVEAFEFIFSVVSSEIFKYYKNPIQTIITMISCYPQSKQAYLYECAINELLQKRYLDLYSMLLNHYQNNLPSAKLFIKACLQGFIRASDVISIELTFRDIPPTDKETLLSTPNIVRDLHNEIVKSSSHNCYSMLLLHGMPKLPLQQIEFCKKSKSSLAKMLTHLDAYQLFHSQEIMFIRFMQKISVSIRANDLIFNKLKDFIQQLTQKGLILTESFRDTLLSYMWDYIEHWKYETSYRQLQQTDHLTRLAELISLLCAPSAETIEVNHYIYAAKLAFILARYQECGQYLSAAALYCTTYPLALNPLQKSQIVLSRISIYFFQVLKPDLDDNSKEVLFHSLTEPNLGMSNLGSPLLPFVQPHLSSLTLENLTALCMSLTEITPINGPNIFSPEPEKIYKTYIEALKSGSSFLNVVRLLDGIYNNIISTFTLEENEDLIATVLHQSSQIIALFEQFLLLAIKVYSLLVAAWNPFRFSAFYFGFHLPIADDYFSNLLFVAKQRLSNLSAMQLLAMEQHTKEKLISINPKPSSSTTSAKGHGKFTTSTASHQSMISTHEKIRDVAVNTESGQTTSVTSKQSTNASHKETTDEKVNIESGKTTSPKTCSKQHSLILSTSNQPPLPTFYSEGATANHWQIIASPKEKPKSAYFSPSPRMFSNASSTTHVEISDNQHTIKNSQNDLQGHSELFTICAQEERPLLFSIGLLAKYNFHLQLPNVVIKFLNHFNDMQILLIGGSVRDHLLKIERRDYDFLAQATQELLLKKLQLISCQFKVKGKGSNQSIEIEFDKTKFDLTCTDDLRNNVYSRDFTVNGLLYDHNKQCVLDYNSGFMDLIFNKQVKLMNRSNLHFFKDQPRSMLRAVRLSAKCGLKIHKTLKKSLIKQEHLNYLYNIETSRLHEEYKYFIRDLGIAKTHQLLHHYCLFKILRHRNVITESSLCLLFYVNSFPCNKKIDIPLGSMILNSLDRKAQTAFSCTSHYHLMFFKEKSKLNTASTHNKPYVHYSSKAFS